MSQSQGVYNIVQLCCLRVTQLFLTLSELTNTNFQETNWPSVEKGEVIMSQCLEKCAFCGIWVKVVLIRKSGNVMGLCCQFE